MISLVVHFSGQTLKLVLHALQPQSEDFFLPLCLLPDASTFVQYLRVWLISNSKMDIGVDDFVYVPVPLIRLSTLNRIED